MLVGNGAVETQGATWGHRQSEFWTLSGGQLGSGLEQHPFLWPQHANEVLMRSEPPGLFWILPSRSTSSRTRLLWTGNRGSHRGGVQVPPPHPALLPFPRSPRGFLPRPTPRWELYLRGKGAAQAAGPQTTPFGGSASKTAKQKHSPKGRGDWHRAFGGVLPGDY